MARRFVFIQVAAPTRSALEEYLTFQERIDRVTERINQHFGREGYQPMILVAQHREHDAVNEMLRVQATELAQAGISLEDKHHSLALHYRLAPNRELAHRLITALLHGLPSDVRVFGGKMVVNVAAARVPNKA
jgi:hypothetical protein